MENSDSVLSISLMLAFCAVTMLICLSSIFPQYFYTGKEKTLYQKLKNIKWIVVDSDLKLKSADGKLIILKLEPSLSPKNSEPRPSWVLTTQEKEVNDEEILFSMNHKTNPIAVFATNLAKKHSAIEYKKRLLKEESEFKHNLTRL